MTVLEQAGNFRDIGTKLEEFIRVVIVLLRTWLQTYSWRVGPDVHYRIIRF